MIEKLLIAKSGKNYSEWLPLWMHLEDTAGIMKYLLKEFVSDSFSFSCELERGILDKTAVFLAYVHDIGKATIGFQYKISYSVPHRLSVLEHYGLIMPCTMDKSKIKDTPHGLAGEEILLYSGCNESIAAVVGAHHGVPSENGNVRNQELSQSKNDIIGYENYFGITSSSENRKCLEKAWKILIDKALKESGFESIYDLPKLSVKAQMLLSGLLIAADWIASNTEYFPLISVDDTGNEGVYPYRIINATESIDFPQKWKSYTEKYCDTAFKNVFGFIPSDIQRKVLQKAEEIESPGLFILEAPMGCGKTEAALSCAEILASKFKKNGLFFGLPTQATANGIFPRIQSWAEMQSEDFYHSIALKHGNAEMNTAFQKIQKGIPEGETDSGLIVHSWFCDNKKACLADFVIATVDQMLMAALKRRHVMLLHLGLSEKVVIIDEVHAYDAYMNRYLERALQWLGAYHTPVILLSATLPAQRRDSMLKAYLGMKKSDKCPEENLSYPLLTWTDKNEIKQEVLPYTGKHSSVIIRKCSDNDILPVVNEVISNGGCVGIILNTIDRAQKTAESLRRELTENVLLYHAQYIMPDRTKREEEILERIGKNSTAETRKGLVIAGTQVLEQSLDIDFDLLITDICPMDLLLQRMGRLHRHERSERPDCVKKPVCYVIQNEYDEDRTGSKMIYGEWLLHLTVSNLPDIITIPDDISVLVNKVYNAFDESPEYRTYITDHEKKKSRASAFLLKEPKGRSIHNLLERSVNDNEAEASVRDGISSVEVLVMQMRSDGTICFLDGTALSPELTEDECKRIAEQKLRLPGKFCQKWNIGSTITELENMCRPYIEKWQKSYWLAGQLVLFLDENNEAELAGYDLKYSFENGLICKKGSDINE